MHEPDRDETHPAQGRQAEDRVVVVVGEPGMDRRQQHAKDHGRKIRLNTEPGDGDNSADQRRNLRTVNAEADPADDREGHPGFLAHVARQVHEEVDQCRADPQGQQDLPAAQAKGIQADGKRVVGNVVHVVGPQGKDAVAAPASAFGLGRCQVLVVQSGTEHHGGVMRLIVGGVGGLGGG
ncbi:hypothetical protein D3C87_1509440 [compost metagenome]